MIPILYTIAVLYQFQCISDVCVPVCYSVVIYILQVLSTHKLMLVTYEEFENEVSQGRVLYTLYTCVYDSMENQYIAWL